MATFKECPNQLKFFQFSVRRREGRLQGVRQQQQKQKSARQITQVGCGGQYAAVLSVFLLSRCLYGERVLKLDLEAPFVVLLVQLTIRAYLFRDRRLLGVFF